MKIGVSVRIDVKKIEKARLFQGEKGTYLDITSFIDLDNKDQYGHNGFVAHSVSKEEREQGVKGAILGNIDVFYRDDQSQPVHNNQASTNNVQQQQYVQNGQPMNPQQVQAAQAQDDDFGEIPF